MFCNVKVARRFAPVPARCRSWAAVHRWWIGASTRRAPRRKLSVIPIAAANAYLTGRRNSCFVPRPRPTPYQRHKRFGGKGVYEMPPLYPNHGSAGRRYTSPDDDVAYDSSLTVGVLGLSAARSVQHALHRLTHSIEAQGWAHQVSAGGEPTVGRASSCSGAPAAERGTGIANGPWPAFLQGHFRHSDLTWSLLDPDKRYCPFAPNQSTLPCQTEQWG